MEGIELSSVVFLRACFPKTLPFRGKLSCTCVCTYTVVVENKYMYTCTWTTHEQSSYCTGTMQMIQCQLCVHVCTEVFNLLSTYCRDKLKYTRVSVKYSPLWKSCVSYMYVLTSRPVSEKQCVQ